MYLCVLGILLNTFSLSISYGKVNRSFLMIANSLIENCVVIVDDRSDYFPYYNESLLENTVHIYLKEEIGDELDNAYLGFYYYYPHNKQICLTHCCQGVSVSLRGKINGFIDYKKTIEFSIEENPNL
jgi:hypothetical protein